MIHGKPVSIDGECGIYRTIGGGVGVGYSVMNPSVLAETISGLSRSQAIGAVTALRDKAVEQAGRQDTPRNLGFPILRQSPEPISIDEVRGKVANTARVCNDILGVLEQK